MSTAPCLLTGSVHPSSDDAEGSLTDLACVCLFFFALNGGWGVGWLNTNPIIYGYCLNLCGNSKAIASMPGISHRHSSTPCHRLITHLERCVIRALQGVNNTRTFTEVLI